MHIVKCTCGAEFAVKEHKNAPETPGDATRGVAECPVCKILVSFDEQTTRKIQEGKWHGRQTVKL